MIIINYPGILFIVEIFIKVFITYFTTLKINVQQKLVVRQILNYNTEHTYTLKYVPNIAE